jgi:hypothetical protein
VYDTVRRPLADVQINVAEGARTPVSVLTDGAGRYEVPGTLTGPVVLTAEKAGYVPSTDRLTMNLSGQIRRDMYLMGNDTVDPTGGWSVTLIANDSCRDMPEESRTRSYIGTIIGARNYPPSSFDLKLQSDTIVPHWSNNIVISVSRTDAHFDIPAWDWGLGIAEDLGQSRQLFIWGDGAGSVGRATMEGVLRGGFEHTDYSGGAPMTVKCELFQLKAVRR